MVQDAAINIASSSMQQQLPPQESDFSGGADAMYAPPTMNTDARSTSVAADPFTSDPFSGGGGEQDLGNPFAQ